MSPETASVRKVQVLPRQIKRINAPRARFLLTKMKKQEKAFFVDNLTEELKGAKSVVLVNYAGLTVKMQQELKKRLKEAGASMLVVKNTLLKRAGERAKIGKELLSDSILSGPTALIIANGDPITPIQVLGGFAKEFEVLQMKVGVLEGNFQDAEALVKISTLPGKDALLGQVLATLMSPSYTLVGVLNANMQKLVYVLQTKSKAG